MNDQKGPDGPVVREMDQMVQRAMMQQLERDFETENKLWFVPLAFPNNILVVGIMGTEAALKSAGGGAQIQVPCAWLPVPDPKKVLPGVKYGYTFTRERLNDTTVTLKIELVERTAAGATEGGGAADAGKPRLWTPPQPKIQ